MVSVEDWQHFGSLETLPQKAGVPVEWLPRLVLKELVDNAYDVAVLAGNVRFCKRRSRSAALAD